MSGLGLKLGGLSISLQLCLNTRTAPQTCKNQLRRLRDICGMFTGRLRRRADVWSSALILLKHRNGKPRG